MIGIFDSGHGGLTVLRALVRRLPDQAFVYLGDHAHAPYGDRAPDDIYRLMLASLERLFALGCRLVVVACNTAAAVGLRRLQQTWLPQHPPGRRVIGVLVPTVEAVTGVPWLAEINAGRYRGAPRTIAVFATRHTVQSGAFVREIEKRASGITVVQQACPALVPLIERAARAGDLREAVQGYTAELMHRLAGVAPETAILGCTHYPLAQPFFSETLPGVKILSQPDIAARSLDAYLRRHPEFNVGRVQRVDFYTTGCAEHVSVLASRFYGEPVTFRPCARGGQ
jgi:glutamate racemase